MLPDFFYKRCKGEGGGREGRLDAAAGYELLEGAGGVVAGELGVQEGGEGLLGRAGADEGSQNLLGGSGAGGQGGCNLMRSSCLGGGILPFLGVFLEGELDLLQLLEQGALFCGCC